MCVCVLLVFVVFAALFFFSFLLCSYFGSAPTNLTKEKRKTTENIHKKTNTIWKDPFGMMQTELYMYSSKKMVFLGSLSQFIQHRRKQSTFGGMTINFPWYIHIAWYLLVLFFLFLHIKCVPFYFSFLFFSVLLSRRSRISVSSSICVTFIPLFAFPVPVPPCITDLRRIRCVAICWLCWNFWPITICECQPIIVLKPFYRRYCFFFIFAIACFPLSLRGIVLLFADVRIFFCFVLILRYIKNWTYLKLSIMKTNWKT